VQSPCADVAVKLKETLTERFGPRLADTFRLVPDTDRKV